MGANFVSSWSLIRLAGLAALSSGVLAAMGDLLGLVVDLENPQSATTASHAVAFLLYLISTALLLLGLVGLYSSQSEAVDVLGLVGFLVAFLGTVLLAGHSGLSCSSLLPWQPRLPSFSQQSWGGPASY